MDPQLLAKLGIKEIGFISEKPIFTVSQITNMIKNQLEGEFNHVQIEGEITNYKCNSSGHRYFSLKDNDSNTENLLQVICWKSISIPTLKDGIKVICKGKITVYQARSQIQIIAQSISYSGKGELDRLFNELKNTLEKKGFFDQKHKKPLPTMPKIIGVITGYDSDAEKDILKRLENRFVQKVIFTHVLVQGNGAADQIIKALAYLDGKVDVIIMARGGGSTEDLAAFNELEVVMAVFNNKTPIITGIGHESNVVLVDYVADLRAPTPTACIEMILPLTSTLLTQITNLKTSTFQSIKWKKHNFQTQLEHIEQITNKAFSNFIQIKQMQLEKLAQMLRIKLEQLIALKIASVPIMPSLQQQCLIMQNKFEHLQKQIDSKLKYWTDHKYQQLTHLKELIEGVSHEKVLKRGFVLVKDMKDQAIVSVFNVTAQMQMQFCDGAVNVQLIEQSEKSV